MSIFITTADTIRERIRPIVDRIISRPQESYSIQNLSCDAGISKFHFHRVFALFYGVNIYEFVLLNRLKLASEKLISSKDTITNIAIDSGYSDAQSFAKAFREFFKQTPSEFKKSPNSKQYSNLCLKLKKVEILSMKLNPEIEIETDNFPLTPIVAFRHQGNPSGLNKSIEQFANWRKSQGLSPLKFATFNLFHNPVENETFDIEIGCEFDEKANFTTEFYRTEIKEQKCAILRHIGDANNIELVASHLYRKAIEKGYDPADYPLFCKRISFPPFVEPNKAETILYLPIL